MTARTGQGLRLLAVHAHPDDEASKAAATTARYASEGVDVLVVTCTGGEAGEILNPEVTSVPAEHLPALRKQELAASIQALGVSHAWLGYRDSGWYDITTEQPQPGTFAATPVADAADELLAIVKEFRPHVVITYDENGGYPHPDHVQAHRVTVAAFERAQKEMSAPPAKLYYVHEWPAEKMDRFHHSLMQSQGSSPYEQWRKNIRSTGDPGLRVTTQIVCSDYFPARDAALLAHRSQIAPGSHWFALPRDQEPLLWPTEDFELVICTVTPPAQCESDLFAGIDATEGK